MSGGVNSPNYESIMRFCVALTNYHINLHPLHSEDFHFIKTIRILIAILAFLQIKSATKYRRSIDIEGEFNAVE